MKKQVGMSILLLVAVALPVMAKAPSSSELGAKIAASASAAQEDLGKQLGNAAKAGNLLLIRQLIEKKGVPVDAPVSEKGGTALMKAINEGQYKAAKMLLERYHANPLAKNNRGFTVLMYAVWPRLAEDSNAKALKMGAYAGAIDLDNIKANIGQIVDLVLSRPDVKENEKYLNNQLKSGTTALAFAVQSAHFLDFPELVQKLVDIPAIDVNKPGQGGWPPLFLAIELGNEKVVRVLLTRDNIDLQTPVKGVTPLAAAEKVGNRAIINMLKAKGARK